MANNKSTWEVGAETGVEGYLLVLRMKNQSRVVANLPQILKSLKDVGSKSALLAAGHNGVLLPLCEVLVEHHLEAGRTS